MIQFRAVYEYANGKRGELVDRFQSSDEAMAAIIEVRKVWLSGPPAKWFLDEQEYDKAYHEKFETSFRMRREVPAAA